MTHFPLPSGYCRPVCRPARPEPRVVNSAATIRFARAAVKHGANPCDLVAEVRKAIGANCTCVKEQDAVVDGLGAIKETWADLWRDLLALVDALFGIKSWEEFDRLSKVKWWQILWSRLKFILSVKEAADALWDVIDDIKLLYRQYQAFREDVIRLIECLNGQSDSTK